MTKTPEWFDTRKHRGLLVGSFILAAWLLSPPLHHVLAGTPDPSSFTLKIEGSQVQLKADGIPLNKILDSIAIQSGIKLRSTEQATEPIYCHLANAPLVETLKKLLRNWNFAFIYKGTGNGGVFPDTLWIISKNPHTDITAPVYLVSTENPEGSPLQDHQKRFEKSALTAVFADSKKILTGITAKDHFILEDPVASTRSQCLQINTLSPDSAIREVGLQEDDLVLNVNGLPVTTAAELIQAIKKATQQETPTLRIDRRHNDMIDPIYIETY